jgi:hypothetical protein
VSAMQRLSFLSTIHVCLFRSRPRCELGRLLEPGPCETAKKAELFAAAIFT